MKFMMIVANWKMNKSVHEAGQFIIDFKAAFEAKPNREMVICPNFLCIPMFKQEFSNSEINIGAQNCHSEAAGAFTGETSASMLKSAGCGYCIVGHSERRTLFNEKNDDVSKKIRAIQNEGLIPIACVGETEGERARGDTLGVIAEQVNAILEAHVPDKKLIIAYEPVWAIGTGKVATIADIHQVHRFIREKLIKRLGTVVGNSIVILYGGSVNPQNAKEIEGIVDVSGFLVGGASLKVSTLLDIY